MKNFTKQNFKTNPLWIRLLIMAFMLLIGTGSAWADYKISVHKNSKEYASANFTDTGFGGIYKATFTISNFTGNTSDYQFWIGNGAWENNKSANENLGTYSSSTSATITIYINSNYSNSGTNYDPFCDLYAIGPAIAGNWETWVKMTNIDDNKYTCPATTNNEFKISNKKGWNDKFWNNISQFKNGVEKIDNSNGKITGSNNQICFWFDYDGKWTLTAEESCTKPSKPTLSKTSDTTCPNVNYTLPTATNKGSYTQKWYNSNGTEITSPVKVSVKTIYTTKLINGSCVSNPTTFTLNVTTAPAKPSISIGSANICSREETYILVNSRLADHTYKLFKNGTEVTGATLNNEDKFIISEAGSYTVKVTAPQAGCGLTSVESDAKTLAVTSVDLTLDPTSAPICSGATLADISTYVNANATVSPSGSATISWYANEEATTALEETTELTATTYYAEAATQAGCKSERKSFEVTSLLSKPLAPVITPSSNAICSGNTVTLTLTEKVAGETYKIGDIPVFTSSKTYTPTLNETTTYTITATNQCGSTNSEPVTINVTTTPVITANKLVTTIGSPITLTSNIDAIWTTTGGILNPNSEETSSVEFTSQNNGRYIITASNTANEITCSASKEVSVQNAFYVYIRRPKGGDNVYNDWYGKTNDAEKGNAPWFKEGTPNYDSMEDTNYGGVGPVESFTDCNDYTWDAFEFAGGYFYIHAPNTGGSDGWATFTKETYIESLSGDVYYYISSFTQNDKGSVLSESATTPERAPEIITPVTSLIPESGILCSGSQATLTVTNPQNDYSYTLMYKGTAQGEPISGNNEVEFTVIEAGSYAVQAKVQSNSGCTSTASSSASQIKVIATDIKFDATEYTTTPWVPVTVVIEVPSGYEFTYNDATLTSITPEADKPIKKENGHEYTYTFPRPTDWGIGNSQSGDGYDEKPYTITATIKNAEQCGTATATVKLQDEGNDKCILPNQ